MRKTNGEPYTRRLVRTVRGQAPGNLPSQGGKAPGAEPTIFEYIGSSLPFRRLWISSLTDRAIRDGFQTLRPGSDYDNLFLSAQARSRADYVVGLNASQALSITAGSGIWSLGRVQPPTLAMICSHYMENKDFTPQTYFRLKAHTAKDATAFGTLSESKYDKRQSADEAATAIREAGTLRVTGVERKEVRQEPLKILVTN